MRESCFSPLPSKRLLLPLALSLIVLAAGCGSPQSATPDASGSPGTTANETVSPAESDESVELRLATTGGPESGNGKGMLKWAELMEDKSGGRITVETFVSGELGAEREIMEQVQLGAVDGALVASSVLASVASELEVYDLPFLFDGREAARAFIEGDEEAQNLLELLGENDLEGLAWTIAGARAVINNGRAVEAPDDMSGMKIRTIESPLFTQLWTLLGATPTPLPVSEIYVALQTGTVDAADIAPNYAVAQGYHEVADHFTNLEHIFGISALFLSSQTYEDLPEDLREIVREAAREAAAYESELNAQLDAEALDTMREASLTVVTDFDVDAFQQAMEPVYESYAERLGADYIANIREAAAKY